MEKKIDKILKKLDGMETKLNDLWKSNNMDIYNEYPPFVQSKSPISLTTLGLAILKKYKGDAYIEKEKVKLLQEIKDRSFKSPLDVQEFSRKLILSKFSSDEFNEIKNLIYETPTWENNSVNPTSLSMIMGLYLRDQYLKKYPISHKVVS